MDECYLCNKGTEVLRSYAKFSHVKKGGEAVFFKAVDVCYGCQKILIQKELAEEHKRNGLIKAN